MKFIHCADIHLGSKMETNLNAIKANERKTEISMTFIDMVKYANDNNINVIVIAGDLFDENNVSEKWKKIVFQTISHYSTITFLYLPGNHDDNVVVDWHLPNFKAFTNIWTSYTIEGVTFSGIQLSNDLVPYQTLNLSKDDKNVVILHGQETKYQHDSEEVINIPLLKNKNIDYLALGHIHSYKSEKLDERGIYCYCGCLEGRGFDECGNKGFVVVEIDENKLEHQFVKFSKRSFYSINVDISDLTTLNDIIHIIDQKTINISKNSLVKIILTGTYEVETFKDLQHINIYLNDKFYFGKVYDRTKLKINLDDYQHDVSLKGELVRNVLSSTLSEEEKEAVIVLGLRALANEGVEI